MAYAAGPKTVTDGLIFNFDSNSERSYAGPPIQNIATALTAVGPYSGPSIEYTSGTETVTIPTLGPMTVSYMDGYNSNPSSYCCLQQFYYTIGNGLIPCSGSTTYTYAIVYRCTSGYTHPNYMYRYEYTSGGSYVTEAGVHDDSKRIHLGDGWYWAWNTFTTQSTTAQLYLRCFYYQYNISDRLSVAKVLVTPGDYTTFPPRLWPAVGTTRSSTATALDTTRLNTITVNGPLVYGNDKITFPNNNSAFFEVSPSTNFKMGTQDFTLSYWLKQLDSGGHILTEARDSSTLQGYLVVLNYPGTGQVAVFINPSTGQGVYYTSQNTMPTSGMQNIAVVVKRTTSSIDVYLNGTLYGTITGINNSSISGLGDMYRIGYDRGGGTTNIDLYGYAHYNRALTEAEIRQNFNAQRGRYGI